MLKNRSVPFTAFLQASGLVAYIILVSVFFTFVVPNFDKSTSEFYAPILMLLIFILSAVVSALLVLGRAGMLFWEKNYKEAFTLLGWTLGWVFFYILFFIGIFLF